MKRNQYVVPVAGSAPLAILATQPSRLVEIAEDGNAGNGGLQGIVLYFAQDNYTTGYTFSPQRQPAVLGNKVAHGKGKGPWVGLPAQYDMSKTVLLKAATILCKATSASNATTTIDVTEYD